MVVSIRARDVALRNSVVHPLAKMEDMDLLWDADSSSPQKPNPFQVQIRVASAISPTQPPASRELPTSDSSQTTTPSPSPATVLSPAAIIENLVESPSSFKRDSLSPHAPASKHRSKENIQVQPQVVSQAGTAKKRLSMHSHGSSIAPSSGTSSPRPRKSNDSHSSPVKSTGPLSVTTKPIPGSPITPYRRGCLPALDPRGIHIKESGPPGSVAYRGNFLEGSNWNISPWHNIPLASPDGLLNCICTTPTGTWVRHEFAPDEPNNPLRIPRTAERTPSHFRANAPWNIGLLPQTLADPSVLLDQSRGDSCPVEVLEISAMVPRRAGEIYSVKPLAAFAVLPDNRKCPQWKVVTIAAQDPMADVLEDAVDLDMIMPGLLEMVREWLRHPACSSSSAAESLIHLNGCAVGLPQTLEVLTVSHEAWQLYTSSLANSSLRPKGPQSPASPVPTNFACLSIPTCGPTMGLGLFYDPALFRKDSGGGWGSHPCADSPSDGKSTINHKAAARARQELISNLKYLDQRFSLPAFSPHLPRPAVRNLLGSVRAHLRGAARGSGPRKSGSSEGLVEEELRASSAVQKMTSSRGASSFESNGSGSPTSPATPSVSDTRW